MAYMNQQKKKQISEALKQAFPDYRFSLSVRHHMTIVVKIKKCPLFTASENQLINNYWYEQHLQKNQANFISSLLVTIKKAGDWYDNSETMTDYFNTAFYIDLIVDVKE